VPLTTNVLTGGLIRDLTACVLIGDRLTGQKEKHTGVPSVVHFIRDSGDPHMDDVITNRMSSVKQRIVKTEMEEPT
jgi:hypothetical protein